MNKGVEFVVDSTASWSRELSPKSEERPVHAMIRQEVTTALVGRVGSIEYRRIEKLKGIIRSRQKVTAMDFGHALRSHKTYQARYSFMMTVRTRTQLEQSL